MTERTLAEGGRFRAVLGDSLKSRLRIECEQILTRAAFRADGHRKKPAPVYVEALATEMEAWITDFLATRPTPEGVKPEPNPYCGPDCRCGPEADAYACEGGPTDALERLEEHNHAILTRVERLEGDLAAGEASDGYHTHRELYEYRMLYNAHAARGWLAAGIPVVKSWKHSDGEPCFGGGWFIVTAELPTGQVSNHYAAEHWHLFDVPEVDLPPEYDGHTSADAAERLSAALATPAPAPQQGGR